MCVWRVLGGALGGLETDEGGGGEKQADPPALQRSAKILTRPKKWGVEEEEVEKEEEEEEGKKEHELQPWGSGRSVSSRLDGKKWFVFCGRESGGLNHNSPADGWRAVNSAHFSSRLHLRLVLIASATSCPARALTCFPLWIPQ